MTLMQIWQCPHLITIISYLNSGLSLRVVPMHAPPKPHPNIHTSTCFGNLASTLISVVHYWAIIIIFIIMSATLTYHDEHGASWHDRVQPWQFGQDGVACIGIVFKHLHCLIKEGVGDVLEDGWDGSLDDGWGVQQSSRQLLQSQSSL